jgi:hypothetical protein
MGVAPELLGKLVLEKLDVLLELKILQPFMQQGLPKFISERPENPERSHLKHCRRFVARRFLNDVLEKVIIAISFA